jgi:hypothetical protein
MDAPEDAQFECQCHIETEKEVTVNDEINEERTVIVG